MVAVLWICAGLVSFSPSDPTEYRAAAAKAGKDPVTHVKLAVWCEAHGMDAERLKHLAVAVAIDPQFARAYCYLAKIDNTAFWHTVAGTPLAPLRERAWRFAMRAAALDDSDPRTQLTLAWCHLWKGEFETVRKHLDIAIKLNPNDSDQRIDCGTTLMYLGEPEAGIAGIGSGGNYALAAAQALLDGPLDAEAVVRRALDIAADICVYTNRNVTIETLKA